MVVTSRANFSGSIRTCSPNPAAPALGNEAGLNVAKQDSDVICDLGTLIGRGASGPVHGGIPPGVRCCEVIVLCHAEFHWRELALSPNGCNIGGRRRRPWMFGWSGHPPAASAVPGQAWRGLTMGRPKCDALARILGECRQMRSALHRPGALWPVRWFTSHRPCQALPYRPKRWGVLVRLLP